MASTKAKYGYNSDPRLSANQLAEYLTATPTRRKSIIKDAKFPKTSIVARYDAARTAIAGFLCDQTRSARRFSDAAADLSARESRPDASDWIKNDCRLSIEAINTFQRAYNSLGLARFDCRPVSSNQPKLIVAGVDVSVSLDATLHREDAEGVRFVGGAILLFSKTETSGRQREDRCKTSAVLAALFSEQHLTYLGQTDPKLCFSIDVFGSKPYQCPSSFKRKLDHIQDSCEEVALRWPTTPPPADYDGPAP
jgi:hypothetical protein